MVTRGYNNRYSDGLAQKKRRRFFVKLTLTLTFAVIITAVSIYFLFFSALLQITGLSIEGAKTINPEGVSTLINQYINERSGILPLKLRKNILFFDDTYIKKEIFANFSVIKGVEINKNLPNDIVVVLTERTPIGTWCLIDQCHYFDEDGIIWGTALRSSGSLLLTVDDMRLPDEDSEKQKKSYMEATKQLAAGFEELGIIIEKIEIPADSIGNMWVHTAQGYYAIFDTNSEIANQLDTLRIFLGEKNDDTNMQYVNVSIEGRAYYK